MLGILWILRIFEVINFSNAWKKSIPQGFDSGAQFGIFLRFQQVKNNEHKKYSYL